MRGTAGLQAGGSTKDRLSPATFEGLELRPIGPAVTSGRVLDIAVQPGNHATYYIASVGGLWKTINAGTSWTTCARWRRG